MAVIYYFYNIFGTLIDEGVYKTEFEACTHCDAIGADYFTNFKEDETE